jgi:hypothetical protein
VGGWVKSGGRATALQSGLGGGGFATLRDRFLQLLVHGNYQICWMAALGRAA